MLVKIVNDVMFFIKTIKVLKLFIVLQIMENVNKLTVIAQLEFMKIGLPHLFIIFYMTYSRVKNKDYGM